MTQVTKLTEQQKARVITCFEEMRNNPDALSKNLATLSLLISELSVSNETGIQQADIHAAMAMLIEPWHEMHRQ